MTTDEVVDAPKDILVLLDTNAYDPIVDDDALYERIRHLTESGDIHLLLTHVQYGELVAMHQKGEKAIDDTSPEIVGMAQTPESVRFTRSMLLKSTAVATYGVVEGISPFGLGMWGDLASYFRIVGKSKRSVNDGLIAETAKHHGAILVTNDKRLLGRASANGVTVMKSSDFADFVNNLN
jgi:rRNA-processing protein FCF1